MCFEKFAQHILYCWTRDIEGVANTEIVNEERARYALEPQLIGYLGGEAGSGKSAVIEALLIFATRRGRRNMIETLAFTGIAAIQVDGKPFIPGKISSLKSIQHDHHLLWACAMHLLKFT